MSVAAHGNCNVSEAELEEGVCVCVCGVCVFGPGWPSCF